MQVPSMIPLGLRTAACPIFLDDLGCKVTLLLSFVYFNFPLWVHHSMTSCLPSEFCYICKSSNSDFPFCIENGPPDCFSFMILGEIYWRQERDAPSITCQLTCDSMSLSQLTRLEIFKQWIFKHTTFYRNCTNTTELLLQISITSIVVFPNLPIDADTALSGTWCPYSPAQNFTRCTQFFPC